MQARSCNEFCDAHRDDTIVLVGSAPSLNDTDLSLLGGTPTIGCNRILNHPTFRPTYLMTSDRRPYIEEMAHGNYEKYCRALKIMLSTTIFDRNIICHNTPCQKPPNFLWYAWRVGCSSTPFNWANFEQPLCSFGSILGPMLQAAVIMGAARIGIVGVDMECTSAASLHFYKDASWEGLNDRPRKLGDKVIRGSSLDLYVKAWKELSGRGIELANLSPWTNTRFSKCFGAVDMKSFLG